MRLFTNNQEEREWTLTGDHALILLVALLILMVMLVRGRNVPKHARPLPTAEVSAIPEGAGGGNEPEEIALPAPQPEPARKRFRIPAPAYYYMQPVRTGEITDNVGMRRNGVWHKGTDFRAEIGTEVFASARGQVIRAEPYSPHGYGSVVTIAHSIGTQTLYAHLSEIYVSEGQWVEQGEVIGLSGNTGQSTGPHLHFEVIFGENPFEGLSPGTSLF